jgi:starch synthase
VVTPPGFLHHRQGASPVRPISFSAHGTDQHALLYEVQAQATAPGVRHYVIDHPIFAWRPDGSRADGIYCIDPPDAPFATDATRFAFFGAAVAAAIQAGVLGTPDVLHLRLARGNALILHMMSLPVSPQRALRLLHPQPGASGVRPLKAAVVAGGLVPGACAA